MGENGGAFSSSALIPHFSFFTHNSSFLIFSFFILFVSIYKEILKQYWGYDDFRGIQEDIIRSVGEGRDTLGLMPTGGGKSITFQVPALASDGLCLVITPLIALMKDQVQNLRKRGIKALTIHSGMSRSEAIVALENCIFGNYKFLYVSPERIDTEIFRIKLRRMKVSLITVDESHCISQWGYDFRPSYLKIARIRELLPGVPVLALTATATPEVVKDIQHQLNFRQENAYIVRRTEDKNAELLHILRRVPGSAIVYVRNRRRTKEVAELLNNEHITASFYHAGLDDVTKDLRQHRWQEEKDRVIVATNAFGMGIDKPNVRLVVHLDLPDSIEAYFQEAGRAGRDGQKAYAVMLYAASDRATLHRRIPETYPDKEYIRQVYEKLQFYYQMAMGDGIGCMREFNIEDFCRKFKLFPVPVDSALKILAQAGYLQYTDEQDNASRLLFTLQRDELYKLREQDDKTELLVRTLLRSYTGLFTDYAFINEDSLATRTGLNRRQVYEILMRLSKQHILKYIPRKKTPYIIYTRERLDVDEIILPPSIYDERKQQYEKRINAMLDYVDDEIACRSRKLLRYFGEKNEHECGQCDVCLGRKHGKKEYSEQSLRSELLELLSGETLTPADVAARFNVEREVLANVLRQLLDNGEIVAINGMLQLKK